MKKEKHLLVIRLSAMGDVAMTLPVINALIRQQPNVRVTVLTKAFLKPLFKQIPRVTVFEAEVKGRHRGIFGLYKLYKSLKKTDIDAVADLHDVLRSNILKVFFKLGGYRFAQIDKGRSEKKALTSVSNKAFKQLKTTHERYADVFRNLGYSVSLSSVDVFSKVKEASSIEEVFNLKNSTYIGIAPYAAFQGKMYPLDLMEEVVVLLNAKDNYQVLLFGGGSHEKEVLDSWEAAYDNVTSMVGKYSFSDELAIISNLDVMLAMDSGNAHLAALFGVATVTLWGVTHPFAGFYPFQQDLENALMADREKYPLIPTSIYGNKLPVGYETAMRTISPEEIFKKIIAISSNKETS